VARKETRGLQGVLMRLDHATGERQEVGYDCQTHSAGYLSGAVGFDCGEL